MSLYLSAQRGDIDRLRDALHSDRAAIRQRASELLGEHADPTDPATVEGLLGTAMDDEDETVRESAIAALDALGPEALDRLVVEHAFDGVHADRDLTVKACGRVLHSDRAELRLAAIHGLERLEDRSGTRFVVSGLNDDDRRVRRRAAGACGSLGDERCVGSLIKRLDDVEPVQRAAIIALGQIGTKQACEALTPLLSADVATVRRDAARALGIARYTPAITALLATVDDEDGRVSGAAFQATMEVLPDLPAEKLETAREQLLDRLRSNRATGATELLSTLAREGRRSGLRRQAIWLLGRLSEPDDESVIEAMITALDGDNRSVRREAREQLAAMAPTRVRYHLDDLLGRNPSTEARAAVAWIYGHIGDERSTEQLERLADDDEPDVRKQAHDALERLGGNA